jgi:hypothetical protein
VQNATCLAVAVMATVTAAGLDIASVTAAGVTTVACLADSLAAAVASASAVTALHPAYKYDIFPPLL